MNDYIPTPVTDAAAQLLIKHPSIPHTTTPTKYWCPACPGADIAGPNSPSHAEHQAQALADAGLLRGQFDLSRVEIKSRLGEPTHVRIERGGVPVVHGYVVPDPAPRQAQIVAQAPREQPNTAPGDPDPVEDRLRALADDMTDTPFTAVIVRQFADEVARLRSAAGGPYDIVQYASGWPELVRQYAERERRVRTLTRTLVIEAEAPDVWQHEAEIVRRVVARLREALDPKPTTSTDGK